MDLTELIQRTPVPAPWTEGDKIPWHEPGFSARMLREHLSQSHDAASRRTAIIAEHVAWIHTSVLHDQSARILDLGCGPGLYTQRLSALGHACTGIDFSPASIDYAREQSAATGSRIAYHLADIRRADFGAGYTLVMFIFGELNVFRPADAQRILAKAYAALEAGGQILLEVSTFEGVEKIGRQPPTWYTRQSGLFSDRPHLYLTESFWDVGAAVATERYFVLDGATGGLTRFAASTQAYQDKQYAAMLLGAGFDSVAVHPSLTGKPDDASELQVIIGVKR